MIIYYSPGARSKGYLQMVSEIANVPGVLIFTYNKLINKYPSVSHSWFGALFFWGIEKKKKHQRDKYINRS